MKGLKLFSRTSDRRTINLASFHSPHSLTWRWLVSFSLFRGDEARVRPIWWGYRANNGLQWGFRIPFVGMVRWAQQRPMWYRDLYTRARDEADTARYERSTFNYAAKQSEVVEGSKSVH